MSPLSNSGILVFGTSYMANQERTWLVDKWIKLMNAVNPDVDLLIIDTKSDIEIPVHVNYVWLEQFTDNIGHLGSTGRDGWGRAFCEGVRLAIEAEYEYAVLIDTDILFVESIVALTDFMRENNINYGTVRGDPYPWMEGGIVFLNVAWANKTDFVGRYDWEHITPTVFPEYRLMDIAGTELYVFDIVGRRNDDGAVTIDNAGEVKWLTHSTTEVYTAFLIAHGYGSVL